MARTKKEKAERGGAPSGAPAAPAKVRAVKIVHPTAITADYQVFVPGQVVQKPGPKLTQLANEKTLLKGKLAVKWVK